MSGKTLGAQAGSSGYDAFNASPKILKKMLLASNLEDSIQILRTDLWKKGYSSIDIVTTSFRVTKNLAQVKESVRLEMMKEIGLTHMRILEGVGTYLQLASMLAKIHKLNNKAWFKYPKTIKKLPY